MASSTRSYDAMLAQLEKRRQSGSLRRLQKADSVSNLQDFSSNDYLDLSTHPELRVRFLTYLESQPSLAATGSRLLSGNSQLVEDLEDEAQEFWQSKDALVCSSGYEANVSIFNTLPQHGDTIIYDELIHASVHVGMKNSRASRKLMFKHNDLLDLRNILLAERRSSNSAKSTFLALETVYSMDGDATPLDKIIDLVRELCPDVHIILDEAHATGVFGLRGRGLVSAYGLDAAPEIMVRLHTFGKGAGSTGAVVLCDSITKQYLLNYAKGLIYSTFMSAPALCLLRASLSLLSDGFTENAQQQLWHRIQLTHSMLLSLSRTGVVSIPLFAQSPIIPILTPRAVQLSCYLEGHGFRVMPVRYPTVARGLERVRVCLRANIDLHVIEALINAIGGWIGIEAESIPDRQHNRHVTSKM